MLSQHHHHHNHKHKHNNTNFSTFILEPLLSGQNWIHTREKSTRRIRHFLACPSRGERSPPVCAWRISALSESHSAIRTLMPSYYNDNCNSSSSSAFEDSRPLLARRPCAPLPPLHSAPAQRNHNNGFDTAAHLAPRANTPYAHARSIARHLRAISTLR